ncbi:hypothetical protein M0R72_18085 [Candidatus Pacearchaeota archaeon]|jgi:hypothetical protein|nr:hypothetical protein [Candidatus Pacearchaeota archaeon]
MRCVKYKCPVCSDYFWQHKDGSYRCGCLPDSDDPQGQELEDRKREARMIVTRGGVRKFPRFEEDTSKWFKI